MTIIGILLYRVGGDRPVPRHRKAGKWRRRERARRVIAWLRP